MADNVTYYNPVNGEYTKIIESANATNGVHSLLEVLLKPGGGNPLHYHTRFTEEFIATKGVLSIDYDDETLHLEPGESKLVPIGTKHRFYNTTKNDIVFRIILRSGQPDFENFIKVLFGLVRDGKTTAKQIPKNIFYAALLLHWGDTHLKNFLFRVIVPFAAFVRRIAIIRGIDKKLLDKYA